MPDLANSGLFLDLEVNPTDGKITQVGATLGDRGRKASGMLLPSAWREIEAWAEGAAYIAGHNLLDHDLAVLARHRPDSPLLRLPIVDTLVFQKRPFHELTKAYFTESGTDTCAALASIEKVGSVRHIVPLGLPVRPLAPTKSASNRKTSIIPPWIAPVRAHKLSCHIPLPISPPGSPSRRSTGC